ncbi:DUF2442 domain-containing protein [Salipaludibacillus agaradhaerens]|uniref:DUF2442 domain-containing protein n=2 Tax=Salipaludibacillus agaradhaerens TaxID=76935 RepID=UPI002150F010|nr:DUF2442 domain-containing protein [Salipaludibacillus agaradhaerens]
MNGDMNKMKKIFLGTLLLIIILAVIAFIMNINTSSKNENETRLLFSNNYMSAALEEEETIPFNIFALNDPDTQGNFDIETVTDVSLNNENIEIVDYTIDAGMTDEGYQLINFILTLTVNGYEIEKAKTLSLFFEDGETLTYDIGEVVLTTYSVTEDLEQVEENTIAYPEPSLDVHLENTRDQAIELISISDTGEVISYDFNHHETIAADEAYHLVIDSLHTEKIYDFYTLTPLLTYEMGEERKSYVMDPVLYGILDQDEVKVRKILSHNGITIQDN